MTKARTLADNFAADINGITAGTGITGGGTSGTVTITNDMATTIAAKGDLVVGTGNDTYNRLAVASTAGYVLQVDSAETTGLKWAAPAAGGKVLQVVSGTYSTETTSTSQSWADTGLSLAITPSVNTSKVLVLVSLNYRLLDISQEVRGGARLLRGSTQIFGDDDASAPTSLKTQASGATAVVHNNYVTWTYLDSPATTSSTTYKVQMAVGASGMEFKAQYGAQASSIVLLEIGA